MSLAMATPGPGDLAGLKPGSAPEMGSAEMEQICGLLEASLMPNGDLQKKVLSSMQQLGKRPEFLVALSRIFVELEEKSIHIRQSAGIHLKNLLKQNSEVCFVDQATEAFLCMQVMKALSHPTKILRHTAGSVLASLMRRRLDIGVIDKLWQQLHVDNADVVEGSMWALTLTSEDLLGQGVDEAFVQIACAKILPRTIELTDQRLPSWLRKQSSDLLMQYLVQGAFDPEKWPAGAGMQGSFLASLGALAMSQDAELVQNSCKGFCSVIEQRWAVLSQDHISMILGFMLRAGEHADEDVRREALAVWRVASEASALHPLLEQNLPELTKVLLANLVYSSADMMAMDAGSLDNDNADRPDSLEEIQPQFHKEGGFSDMDKAEKAAAGSTFLSEEWTARRAAADALDALAGYAGTHPQVCSRMLPMISEKLQSTCWKQQEAGIHALGCIGASCIQVTPELLDGMIRLLLSKLTAEQPLLRSAACLSLTQFLPGVIMLVSGSLPVVMSAILERCRDTNKHVQAAAVESLTTILQVGLQAGPVKHFMEDVFQTFIVCLDMYKVKNLRKLYQCVAGAVGASPELFTTERGQAVLGSILQRFFSAQVGDPTAMAIFESMASIVQHLASFVAGILPRIVDKAVRVVNEVGYAMQIFKQNPEEYEPPDQELMAAAVDILASAMDGLQAEAVGLLKQNNFLCILPLALTASSSRARQSGFWLLGSAAPHCKAQVQPLLSHLLEPLVAGMKLPAGLPVNWSAVWALGELCQRVDPPSLEPAIPQITEAFVGIFQRRVGMEVLPNQLAAHRQLLGASCFTVNCLKHTSTLGDRWPSCKRLIPEENLKQLQSQYGFCD
ncbi:Tnpo1 [Symbiodinium necroappetens]|uniref:Tnpo1 protein n=1 Tax=Symbiodinium necroappetens TaxID=1628268 RepID=A0A812PK83_9DINO|nr:Tnpo1 [Symbiodinium necroappetens]